MSQKDSQDCFTAKNLSMASMIVVIMWEVEIIVRMSVVVEGQFLTKPVGIKMVSLKP